MSRIRVLVVDDSVTVRKRIVEMLSEGPDFTVVGEAENGKQGFEMCQSLRPDVVTLDMMMPVMSGLAATETIMAYCPTPILVVSSSTNRGELFKTYEALAAGALDVMDKPGDGEPEEAWFARLASTLRLISRIRVITHPRARLGLLRHTAAAQAAPPAPQAQAPASALRAIAIGASTGGPGAVLEILRSLPKDFPLPILLVIHLSRNFGMAFAEWLDGESHLRVAFASNGDYLPPLGQGQVLMAPPDEHLELREGRLWLSRGPERHSCRPSVDVLFESVAKELGKSAAGCLLTGMGKDGAAGLLAMKNAGAQTIAQGEASCVVYGMPREAVMLGAASKQLQLDEIAPCLAGLAEAGQP
jgi:two-component system chemotaxis response regulator CheB